MRPTYLLILLATAATACSADASEEAQRPRLVLIALDAVPYDVVKRVSDPAGGERAAFVGFARPVPLISTFPSTTTLALGGILAGFGLERSPGYEHRYFDRSRNRKLGGGPFSYRKLLFPWREFFDWQSNGVIKKGLHLLNLERASRRAIDRSLSAFAASDQATFHIYHDLTDLMAHVKGPDSLEGVLRYLDGALRELRGKSGVPPFHTVLYSDHGIAGGVPLSNVRRGVRRALRQDGRRIARRLREPRDVVLDPYGLISSFVAFTARDQELAVAEVLAQVEGVDLCVAAAGDGWRIFSERGDARVRRRLEAGGERYAYLPLTGDPLGYADYAAGASADGWRSDAWWFAATRDAYFPDALYRIARGFELVRSPASVICSTAPGYLYGAAYTVLGSRLSTGRLRWTHGALEHVASRGFVMSDTPGWRATDGVRFDQALAAWEDRERSSPKERPSSGRFPSNGPPL